MPNSKKPRRKRRDADAFHAVLIGMSRAKFRRPEQDNDFIDKPGSSSTAVQQAAPSIPRG